MLTITRWLLASTRRRERPRSALLPRDRTTGNEGRRFPVTETFLTVFMSLRLITLSPVTPTVAQRTLQLTPYVPLSLLTLYRLPTSSSDMIVPTNLIEVVDPTLLKFILRTWPRMTPPQPWQGGRKRIPCFRVPVPFMHALSLVRGSAPVIFIDVVPLVTNGRGFT